MGALESSSRDGVGSASAGREGTAPRAARPLRIAIDYTSAINQSAGIGRFVRQLVGAMVALDPTDSFLLIHAAPNPGRIAEYPEGKNVHRRALRLSERWLNRVWHRLKVPLPVDWLSGPVDIFHSPDFVLPPVRRARTILTVHDLAFLLYPECADSHLRAYLERTVPRSVSRADFVVADSENTRNDVIVLLGVPPDRVAVVPGGVDPSFRPVEDPARRAALRTQIGLDAETPYILFVGVIEPRKNLIGLIEAFDILKSRRALPHKLVVVGRKGWLWEGTMQRADRSPYRDDIIFPGFIPDGELATLYSAAEMFAFPSHYEGFGLPALEAMACGTPVVASRASSLPEVVGDAGIQVDPNDREGLASALELLALNPDIRADFRRRGLERAATFTWQAAAEAMLDIYHRVARGC
ncbi:MAG: glycosyltransferase family 4 protein [Chloroflexi bacterium]|nr:glycosyltransferase family 4 protein [Chloroflexota bacterium]